jgi:O-antigen/teichoic acid export membrane protein
MPEPAAPAVRLRGRLADARERVGSSDTMRAAELAVAMVVTNAVALALTLVFGRILGTAGYGEVAALISAFLILAPLGQAMQLATARAGVNGELGVGGGLRATLQGWTRELVLLALAATVVGVLLRVPIARLINVDAVWAAAALLPTGIAWLLLSIQRGALQAVGAYREVGVSMVAEQAGRLVFGVALALPGLGATGAFLGTPLAMLATSIWLDRDLRGRLGAAVGTGARHLRTHARRAATAIVGLALLASLQNIDVIVAKHRLGPDSAGAYAAAAVAAKVVVWVAVGVAFWVVPEATRRAAEGLRSRGVLLRGLALLAVAALPALAIYAFAPELLLRLGFGPKFAVGGDALLLLGVAMTILAGVFLATQYLLALNRWKFLPALAVVALAEPFVLALPPATRPALASVVLLVQLAAAAVVGVAVLRRSR